MPVTLKDIAKECNISVNSVSRALRNMPDIGPDTTKLVHETAMRLGYHKNLAAGYLRTKKSMILGLIVTDICNPVFSSMYKGIEKVCMETNYSLLLGNSNENAEEENALISNMLNHGIDGLFLVPCSENANTLDQLTNTKLPILMLQRRILDFSTNSVLSNDYEGGRFAAAHLYQLGHRSFLYVTAPMYISSAQDRYNGFIAYLNQKGLSKDCVEILECNGSTRSDSHKAMSKWLKQFSSSQKPSVTSVFCFSDYVAYGVYSALAKYNLRIPEDISVIGYDNIEYSDMTLPPLTTIDMKPYHVGEHAAKIMIDLINNKTDSSSPVKEIMSPKLIVRNSTAQLIQ